MPHRYRVRYSTEIIPGDGLTKEEVIAAQEADPDVGFTDALLVASIIYPEDGSLSVLVMGLDGRTGLTELADIEVMKVWSLLADRLAKSKTLDEGRRSFCAEVFEMIKVAHGVPKNSDGIPRNANTEG